MILPALYRGLTAAAAPLVVVYLQSRRRRGKEDTARYAERLGVPGGKRPDKPLVWVHAASIGEATSALALIERVLRERPGLEVLITTGTVTAARLLEPRLPCGARHQFVPVDLPGAVGRFLDHWRPDLALWVESELWPNLVLMTARRHIPMLLLNARLSARSHAHWRLWGALARPMVASFALCLAQDDDQGARFRELGARQVASVGDLKSAAKTLPTDASALALLRQQIADRPRWLAASTHPGEEDIAMAVHRRIAGGHPGLLTVIAPRHPIRGDEIAAMAAGQGLRVARRSRNAPIAADSDIYLADTFGELGVFYSLAGIAFIGGSLIDRGGHNPFEAARLDCAVLLGPYTANCLAMAEALTSAGAAEIVADGDALAAAVGRLLDDAQLRGKRAKRAARVAADGLATLDAVLDRIAPWLDPLAPAGTRRRRAPMRAPDFWDAPPGFIAGLLAPVGAAIDAAGRLRRALARPYRAPVPVICVGNLVAGGAGKTPVVLSLAAILAGRGIATAIVTRGYGGRLAGPLRVDPAVHDAEAVGDEALLAAASGACWVSRDRADGVRAAVEHRATAVILDDGFQNPHVAKDLSLVVIDAAYGFGNCRLIPAGPLRERIADGLARATAIVLIGDAGPGRELGGNDTPILRATLDPIDGERFAGVALLAFAGIGRPEKFFATLRSLGAQIVAERGFPDHHRYRDAELAALRRDAASAGAMLVTTAKDWVRLPPAKRAGIAVLDVELRWRDSDALDALLAPLCAPIGDDGRHARG